MIQTEIQGSTTSIDAAATWLRDSLKVQVDQASEDVLSAKRTAELHWEGLSGAAYVEHTRAVIRVSDAHVDRISTAADELDAYSVRLKQAKDRMGTLRNEAQGGGLGVAGTVIYTPPNAVAPTPLAPDASEADRSRFTDAMGTFQTHVDMIELYERILSDVELEWSNFMAWVDTNLKPVPTALEAPDVDELADAARSLATSFGMTLGERSLQNKTKALRAQAEELRTARRSGNPARRARGNAPDAPGRVRDLNRFADWAGRGGRILGPVGAAWDTYQALEGDSPGGGLLAVAAGAGATALVIATLPVSVPTIVVVAGAVAVGAGVTWMVAEGWDALPDDWTEPVDEWVGDRWDDTKSVLSDGWGAATGWI